MTIIKHILLQNCEQKKSSTKLSKKQKFIFCKLNHTFKVYEWIESHVDNLLWVVDNVL